MFPNTSTQSQDQFKDCLSFARQLSQSSGLYCRLEVERYPSQEIYSLLQIYLSWMEQEALSLKKD